MPGQTRASILFESSFRWMDFRVKPVNDEPRVSHTGFSVTFNPSRGFGIGHICQSGV